MESFRSMGSIPPTEFPRAPGMSRAALGALKAHAAGDTWALKDAMAVLAEALGVCTACQVPVPPGHRPRDLCQACFGRYLAELEAALGGPPPEPPKGAP